MILILLFNLVFNCLLSFADWNTKYFQNGCSVFTYSTKPQFYPGEICIFLDDGTFISAGANGIRRFKNQTTIWETPGFYHHQVNLSVDKKRILALGSETTLRDKVRERDDVVLILDLETGKVLQRRPIWEILTEKKLPSIKWMDSPVLKITQADQENSHFNSIYEIAENEKSSKVPYLKQGNVLINGLRHGIFILSPDLSSILYHTQISHSQDHHVHDVQVTKAGEFLFFNNRVRDPESKFRHSSIDRFDPVRGKMTFHFTAEPKGMFYSRTSGSVQEVSDDLIFFSHAITGGYLYSKKQKKVILTLHGASETPNGISVVQQIKVIDIQKFLENSK